MATYVLLNIRVANSHATSAYECELPIVIWHYLPSVRLNPRSVSDSALLRPTVLNRDNGAYHTQLSCMVAAFFKRSILIAAFILATLKQNYLQTDRQTEHFIKIVQSWFAITMSPNSDPKETCANT